MGFILGGPPGRRPVKRRKEDKPNLVTIIEVTRRHKKRTVR
jgi:hypothetical protein